MANEAHKIKLLVLWDILCKNTDENHALNTDEISELLALRGLNVSRKILVQDIATLCDNGYEVLSYKKKYHYFRNRGLQNLCLRQVKTITTFYCLILRICKNNIQRRLNSRRKSVKNCFC